MKYLYTEFLLLDVSHRFQVLFFACLLLILVITVIALTVTKFLKELAEK